MPIGQFREEWRIRRGISQLSVGGGVARQSHLQKIISMFGTSLIGYWPGSEEAGTVAVDYSGNGYNGVYTGVTLGQEGIGDGLTCPLYDGANDFMQPPAGFRTAFNPSEGTMGGWLRVSAAGIWTDGLRHFAMQLRTDLQNLILIEKTATNNQLSLIYKANNVSEQITTTSFAVTTWLHTAITWSVSGDIVAAYINGASIGTSATLATWAGALSATQTLIGANITTPTLVWDGPLMHWLCLNRAATSSEVAKMATI